jgi:hypothetical protein
LTAELPAGVAETGGLVTAAVVAGEDAPDGDGGDWPQPAAAVANATANAIVDALGNASVGSKRDGFGALTPAHGA